jgi:alginate O-acetyltransferase complex protein AlgI
MLFTSWEFFCLLVITYIFYYCPLSRGPFGKSWQVTIVLVASMIFYGWEDPKLIILLGISCIGNSISVRYIITNKIYGNDRLVATWTRRAVIMNLGLLAMFKYLPFLIDFISLVPPSWVSVVKALPLPIGISFYTFHGISMVVDVARGEVTHEISLPKSMEFKYARFTKEVRDIAFYLLFFPQLIAGPIVKAKVFFPQIDTKKIKNIQWKLIVRSLITGYFFKIFVADNLSEQTAYLSHQGISLAGSAPINLILLLYCYSLQIFADFAGYSLIAIGLAGLFGYNFPVNFNYPYISTSFTEFWKRWHMSLSAWLRDYLYIPLGGNRRGHGRTYVNLFLVMFLGGFWHGAEWKFAVWGILHGVFLAVERFVSQHGSFITTNMLSSKLDQLSNKNICKYVKKPVYILRWLVTFHLITLLWLTFLMPDLDSIYSFFEGVFNGKTQFSGPPVFCIIFYGVMVMIYHIWGWIKEYRSGLANRIANSPIEPIIHAIMIFLVITNPGAPSGFIYFQF